MLQRVIVVDGATHSQKDGVEGNGGSLKDCAEDLVLFLHGAQLLLRVRVRVTQLYPPARAVEL